MLFKDIKIGSYFCMNDDYWDRVWYKPEQKCGVNAVLVKKHELSLCWIDPSQHFVLCTKDGEIIHEPVKYSELNIGDFYKHDLNTPCIFEKIKIKSSTAFNAFSLRERSLSYTPDNAKCYKCDQNGKPI